MQAEQDGAPESEVRRKADPARERVRDFLSRYRGDRAIEASASFEAVSAILRDLGAYYQERGPRAALTADFAIDLLLRLDAAESLLPASEERRGLFGA